MSFSKPILAVRLLNMAANSPQTYKNTVWIVINTCYMYGFCNKKKKMIPRNYGMFDDKGILYSMDDNALLYISPFTMIEYVCTKTEEI